MAHLANSIDDLQNHYEVIVVGSGYGGAITASRMARAHRSVCVIERGKELQPGEYPNTLEAALEHSQLDTPPLHIGSETNLYDFRINDDINVFLGCGLGGTSLVNANVSLEPDPRVFDDNVWPTQVRQEASDPSSLLHKGYGRARAMLNPQRYPDTQPDLPKLDALLKSAQVMNCPAERVPINVTFVKGANSAGVVQEACNGCGDCVTGCNQGAKNTVLMNYLPDAKNFGAQIFTEIAVRSVEPKNTASGKTTWVIHVELLGANLTDSSSPFRDIEAEVVVLAGGTLGSTEILLRSRDQGLSVSNQVGCRFSGNGDVLGFGYNNDVKINGIGAGDHKPDPVHPIGPCITGRINLCDPAKPLAQGMTIEEGSLPGAIAKLMPAALAAAAGSERAIGVAAAAGAGAGGTVLTELTGAVRRKEREIQSLILGPYHGATENTQTYLVMAHDGSDGTMVLEDNRLRIKWPGVGKRAIFAEANEKLKQATDPLEGVYVSNPLWSERQTESLVTVHPLGGCTMSDDAEHGVVNHKGQVFSGNSGAQVYEGLYVSDGAVIPRSLGVNPLLTISALAERCCEFIAADRGWTIKFS